MRYDRVLVEGQVEAAPPGAGAQAHPECQEEQLHLGAALEAIQRWMARPLQKESGVADFASLMAMEEYRAWRRIELRAALRSPYFARIDFVPADRGRRETYYVGKAFFEGEGVKITGWQAPVAALFYRALEPDVAYDAPEGRIRGRLQLKRRLVIEQSQLAHIADDLDARPATDRPAADGLLPAPSTADLLRAILSEGASPWLRDIIATIQPDQYALITAHPNQVLVVQGVAGSGKTSIALHRLSYMVYPALVDARIPPRCVVFGPNRLFLRYVSAVLPALGLQHVTQTTFTEWALERMRLGRVAIADRTFETLLDPSQSQEAKHAANTRSRLKTSRRMGMLLERYVEWRRRQVQFPDDGWPVSLSVPRTVGTLTLERRVPADELRARCARFADKRLAVHRGMFAESVLTYVYALFETNARGEESDAEAQMALGKRRLEQAQGMREEAERLRRAQAAPATGPAQATAAAPSRSREAPRFGESPRFGEAPRFGQTARSGAPAPAARTSGPAFLTATSDALQQQIRQIELAAARRQQEGEQLVREAREALGGILTPEVQEQVRAAAREVVQRLADDAWPPLDPAREYAALLGNQALLLELADGIFTADEVALLTGGGRITRSKVDLSDLPAMHYLFVIAQDMEEVGRTQHDFMVVDEAQDVAELDLLSLRLLERRNSVTLLGDLSQSIYGHRGLTSWAQAEAIFGSAPY